MREADEMVGRLQLIRRRGVKIARMPRQIRRIDASHYSVKSQSNSDWYDVTWHKTSWKCDCPYHAKTNQSCKHIYAVLHRISVSSNEQDSVKCPRCGREDRIIRRGYSKTRCGFVPRYECKRCPRHRFGSRTDFERLKYSGHIVTTALDLFFKGLSLRSIADHINQFQGFKLSHLTVYRWVRRYSILMARYSRRVSPKVSGIWHADETKVNVNGHLRNLWFLMDHKTRYILAVQVTN